MSTVPSSAEISGSRIPPSELRPWFAAALVAAYWIAHAAIGFMDIANSRKFFYRLLPLAIVVLLFAGWWLFNRRVRLNERLIVLGGAVAAALISLSLRDPSVKGPLVVGVIALSLKWMVTGWGVWLVATRSASAAIRRWGMLAIAALAWAWCIGVRMEGLSGQGEVVFYPRWTASSEEEFMAEHARGTKGAALDHPPAKPLAEPLMATSADWPGFRGPERDGAVRGVEIKLDWDKAPPTQLWKRRVGPGWSSIAVIGNRLFTQEQREQQEAVVCFDANTGEEIWSHEDPARFDESMGGVGPRATPTFHDGRLYALGAKGLLNCLDAATGRLQWSRDITKEGQGSVPYWGFCSSPLIVDGKVIVFAGGGRQDESAPPRPEAGSAKSARDNGTSKNRRTLIAYDAESGDVAWQAPSGNCSYSSPQLFEIDGQPHVLFVSDFALDAVDPATGEILWSFPTNANDGAPAIQPHRLGDQKFLATFNGEVGVIQVIVSHNEDKWSAAAGSVTRDIKPFFNDLVRVGGDIYGFDGSIFCCVDARTGKRNWKKGRYGSGQVLLLADQQVLLVLSESGEVVLVAANPDNHEELGRFQAIEGKTWNHPTVVRGRLYVRNAEEMACYEL